jgi:hypothetical protein
MGPALSSAVSESDGKIRSDGGPSVAWLWRASIPLAPASLGALGHEFFEPLRIVAAFAVITEDVAVQRQLLKQID